MSEPPAYDEINPAAPIPTAWHHKLRPLAEWPHEWANAIVAAIPPADRIALARELLEGTGRVVARDVEAPEVATSWFAGGWAACRATMLADDGDRND